MMFEDGLEVRMRKWAWRQLTRKMLRILRSPWATHQIGQDMDKCRGTSIKNEANPDIDITWSSGDRIKSITVSNRTYFLFCFSTFALILYSQEVFGKIWNLITG